APATREAARAPATFLPPLIRRRCSNLTRASLEVAHACVPGEEASNVESVFVSRHGEAEVTEKVLEALARGEAPSPNDFSVSVHNTASGLFSIHTKNLLPSTAIAASSFSLEAAFAETSNAFARNRGAHDVLVVVADMPCPDVFEFQETSPCFALGMLFTCRAEDASRLTWTLRASNGPEMQSPLTSSPSEVAWLRWAFLGADQFGPLGGGTRLQLRREGVDWNQLFTSPPSHVTTSREAA
ncbi:MAG: beta-ketoacyl synthase chain length factor, partial [Deltaproteobacteria bacterium]|nr:beta-ketoacyl synthase chain length factor [Deltaproteobacteria bacterium]